MAVFVGQDKHLARCQWIGAARDEIEDAANLLLRHGRKFLHNFANIEIFQILKTADTGTRIPRNTHAPLTFPGTLSSAGHCDQSSMSGVSFLSDTSGNLGIAIADTKVL